MSAERWDTSYEWRAVALLATGFGLVGLDRFIILPLFPTMMKDLGLDYQDLGLIASAFSIAWGLAAILMGGLSDKIGRRLTLIPAVIVFSLFAGCSGLANGLMGLLMIRILMGVSEGAYTPASIAATIEASKPSRRGFNLGCQQELFAVLGLGIGPIIATQLLSVVPSWRVVFVIVSLPGFILAWLMYRTLRDTQGSLASAEKPSADRQWSDVFKHRNVPLNMIGMCCMLTCLLVMSTMVPNYLVDYLHLETTQMGFVMSAIGFGGFAGQLLLPGLSDRVGRKAVVLGSYVGTFVSLAGMMSVGANPVLLFVLLFFTSFFNNSMICLNVGPLTSEAVSAAYTSTATGLVVGAGEVFGGGIAPSLAGYVALHFGIQFTFYLALGGLALGFAVALGLRETAPLRLKLREAL